MIFSEGVEGDFLRFDSGAIARIEIAEKRAALAKWQVKRDALFAEYGLTARTQGRNA